VPLSYPNPEHVEDFRMRMSLISTASWRAALPDSATAIGISRGTPRGTGGYRRLRALEPGPWFRSVTPARYLELYSEILSRLDPAEIYDRLVAFSDNPVLLCWETASDCHLGRTFCHRHLVAQWLEDSLDIEVPEVGHLRLDRFAFLRAHGIKAPNYRTSRTHPTIIGSDKSDTRN
jgi:hypothetical protein